MAFEYSSSTGNQRFIPPNPLKLQNLFLGTSGAILLLAGVALLLVLRAGVRTGAMGSTVGGLLVSVFMIGAGATLLGYMAAQLRFWFGRERPHNLSSADQIVEILKQRALAFPEPKGALNGLLYSWIPDLIFSPLPLQQMAQLQFRNAVTMAALLVSLCVALLGGRTGMEEQVWSRVTDWVALIYLVLAGSLIGGKLGFSHVAIPSKTLLERNGVVFLIVFSIIGPLFLSLLATVLPALHGFSPYPHIFLLFIAAVGTYTLFLFALLRQCNAPPRTEVSMEQQAWSINCQPSQILGEFDRIMQDRWQEKIPNRRYWHQPPEVNLNAGAGAFAGGALEETQPIMRIREALDLQTVLRTPRQQLLVALDAVGACFVGIAAIALYIFGAGVGQGDASPVALLYGLAFLALGTYAFRGSHHLWKRFDFESRVTWLELSGNYVAANMEHGNTLQDTVKTSSKVVQVESMTARVWSALFETVTFGVDTPRYVTGTVGQPDATAELIQHLRAFSQDQAMIVAPSSRRDAERHAALTQMNRVAQAERPDGLLAAGIRQELLRQPGGTVGDGTDPNEADPNSTHSNSSNSSSTDLNERGSGNARPDGVTHCTQCGRPAATDALFCGGCGTRLSGGSAG